MQHSPTGTPLDDGGPPEDPSILASLTCSLESFAHCLRIGR